MALAWRCDRCKKYFCGASFSMKITETSQIQLKDGDKVKLEQNPEGKMIGCDLCRICAGDIYEEILDPRRNMKVEEKNNEC